MTFIVEYTLGLPQGVGSEGYRRKVGEEDLVGFILKGFLLSLVCIFGVIGNVISGVVLIRKEMRSFVNCLFLGLAISDTLFLLSQFLVFGLYNFAKYFSIWPIYRFQYDPILTPYTNLVSVVGQTGAIYFTLAITMDRFIVVYYPLHAKKILSWLRAGVISICIIILAVLSGLPYVFGLEAFPLTDDDAAIILRYENETALRNISFQIHDYGYSEFGKSEIFQHYIHWGQTVFHCVVPFTALSFLNFLIAIKVRESQKLRHEMSSSRQSEISVAKMLLCVVAVFGICYSPMLLASILSFFLQFDWSKETKYRLFYIRSIVWCVLELTLAINSAGNFIIYYVMGNRFRVSLIQLMIDIRNGVVCRESRPGAI